MKKTVLFIFLMLLALFTLCSCGNNVYYLRVNEINYRIDSKNQTIEDGSYAYQFDISGHILGEYTITIVYPNKTKFIYDHTTSTPKETWEGAYENRFTESSILTGIVISHAKDNLNIKVNNNNNNNNNNISINKASKLPVIGISILLILLGLFYLLLPEIAFEIKVFRFRWLLKTSSEPTDGVILFYRILGGITSIIGIIILIILIIV